MILLFGLSQVNYQKTSVCLDVVAKHVPGLIGGSADLAPSNNTNMPGLGYFSAESTADVIFIMIRGSLWLV